MKRQTDDDGRVYWSIRSSGKEYRYYEDSIIIPSDVWDDISHLQQKDPERTGYDTQKPETLLERMILSTSRQDDWIGDFFAGSGTTLAAAQKNRRRWLAIDNSAFSIHVSRKRILPLVNGGCFAFSDPSLTITHSENCNKLLYTTKKINNKNIEIKLLNYLCRRINELSDNFLDYIDFWSVGFLHDSKFFACDYTYRTFSHYSIKDTLVISGYDDESDIAIHIVDIYGKQLLIKL